MHESEKEDFFNRVRVLRFKPAEFEIIVEDVSETSTGLNVIRENVKITRNGITIAYPAGHGTIFPNDALQDVEKGKFGKP